MESLSAQPRLPHKALLALLAALMLVSLGLRVYRLGDRSVWWDEGYSIWLARQSTGAIAQLTAGDVHPPLYYWMLHVWRLGSGDGEFGLRFLSAALGVLAVAATYRAGRRIGGSLTGLLAALFMGISPFAVAWSQEMRMYALAVLLAVLSLWAAFRVWDRDRPIDWVLYVLFMSANLYTLYLSASMLILVNLTWPVVLWRAKNRWRAAIRWGLAQVAVLVLFAPWAIYTASRAPAYSVATPVALDAFLRIYWTVLTVGIITSVENYFPLTLPMLAVFIVGLAALARQARRDWRMGRDFAVLCFGLLVPAAIVYLGSLPRNAFFYSPQFAPRYLLIFLPAYCILLAWGLVSLGRERIRARSLRPIAALALCLPLVVAGYGLWDRYPGMVLIDDYKSLAATLRAYRRVTDAVVLYTDTDWTIFAYHYGGDWNGVPNHWSVTPEVADTYLAPIWNDHDGVWLVTTPYAGVSDPQGRMPAWLQARAVAIVEYRFSDKLLRFYARTTDRAKTIGELAPDAQPPHVMESEVAPGLRLAGYDQAVQEYYIGDPIHLFLYWEPGDTAAGSAGIVVSLMDDGGQAVQSTQMLAPETSPTGLTRQQVDLTVSPDAPGGVYSFAVRSALGGGIVRFGRVRLRSNQQAALTTLDVSITHPLETDFGDSVRLLGYDVEAETARPGGTVRLTLYWQARQPVAHVYKVFTHVLGEVFNAESGNFLWGQQDNEPVSGTRPTPTWRTGEVIVDRYSIALPALTPPGRYTIEIGLYDPATGTRLPVLNSQGNPATDHVELTTVTVEAAAPGAIANAQSR